MKKINFKRVISTVVAIILFVLIVLGIYICFNYYLQTYFLDDTSYRFKVDSKDAIIIAENDDYVLYDDNGLKLFDKSGEVSRKINIKLPVSIDNVNFWLVDSIGFIYNDEKGNNGFYSFDSNTVLFEKQYDELRPILHDGNFNASDYLLGRKGDKYSVISLFTQKVVFEKRVTLKCYQETEEGLNECENCQLCEQYVVLIPYETVNSASFFITYIDNYADDTRKYTIYTISGKFAAEIKDDEYFIINDDTLTIYKENKKIYQYDIDI